MAAIAGAYIFRLAYIGWFGPYLVVVVAAAPLLLFLLSLPSMGALHLSLSAPSRCIRGSGAQLRVDFQTRSHMPISCVMVTIQIENRFTGELSSQTYKFRGILSCNSYLPLPTGDCGLLVCRISGWECRDLLGIFSIRRRSDALAKCAVLPEPFQPDTPLNMDAAMNSAVQLKPKYGGGYSEEHDLRAYQPGDTVNSIHWKLSSKTDTVIVREPLICENNEVYLVLAQVGANDRGLEALYWLSLELCQMEIPHIIVSAHQYPVGNEEEAQEALASILSAPISPPCPFDRSLARCVFILSDGEVTVK